MGCERGERRDHKVSVACSRLHLGDTLAGMRGGGDVSHRTRPSRGRHPREEERWAFPEGGQSVGGSV